MNTVRHAVAFVLLSVAASRAAYAAGTSQDRFPLPPKEWPAPVEDSDVYTFLLLDRLEYRRGEDHDTRAWDAQAWIGGDYNKLWLKTEGEANVGGPTERAEAQALYARRVSPFWHLQAGVRYDFKPEPSRRFAVVGVQGLAPYGFDMEATTFLSDDGDVSARLKAEYDLLFTQRLILQPQLETNFSANRVGSLGIGRGVNDVTLALRLRYEIKREVAPYIGVNWTRRLGETADFVRRGGGDVDDFALVAGVRLWF